MTRRDDRAPWAEPADPRSPEDRVAHEHWVRDNSHTFKNGAVWSPDWSPYDKSALRAARKREW